MTDRTLSVMIGPSDQCLPLRETDSGEIPQPSNVRPGLREAWQVVLKTLDKHYRNPDIEAARILCAALAAHGLKEYLPAWCMAIALPGSIKTDFLESFRGLPGVAFRGRGNHEYVPVGKVDEKHRKRTKPASWLHRIGNDGVLIAADFSTFTSNPKTLQTILAQLRRIYDGHFSREFGTDENMDERAWQGRLTVFAAAVPDIDRHYSLFQNLGERFVRVRLPRAGGVETGLRAMKHTGAVATELRAAVHALMLPLLSNPQQPPTIPEGIESKIAHLSEFIALARTYIEREGYSREASGVPAPEGNTRLPQELCQIARGSALLDGRAEVNDDDYKLVRRAAFDSLPPARIAVLKALFDGKSPFSLGLPKATIERAIEDLELAGVLTEKGDFSGEASSLLAGACVTQAISKTLESGKSEVPENCG